jgi:hypothetical protein
MSQRRPPVAGWFRRDTARASFQMTSSLRSRSCGSAKLIQQVEQAENRVAKQHSPPGIPHNFLDPSPHHGLIAVNRTTGTGRLFVPEPTMIQTSKGVVVERLALAAEGVGGFVMIPAVHPHHRLDGLLLA